MIALRTPRFLAHGSVALLLLVAAPLGAQARPTTAQAEALLRSRPDLATRLQSEIAGSGLSAAQIRERLKAAGYPESLLDSYLSAEGARTAGTPSDEVFDAVRALGLVDESDLEELLRRSASVTDVRRSVAVRATPDSVAAADSGLTIFGLAMFRDASTLFLPNLDGPVDAGYRIGPGDQLVLILTGDVEVAHSLEVTREGFVVIPQVGQVGVANLTLAELESLLYSRLGRVYSGVRRGSGATTRFSISVSRLRSNQVFVTGDVVAPGSYRVTSAGTALTALYAAGGPTERGSLRRIEVRRGGALVSTLDVYDYLLRGDGSADVRLQHGDVVFVPLHGARARVVGAIARPATYELKDGESLADLTRAAGGLRATATGRRLIVERIIPFADRTAGGARSVVDVPLSADGSVPPLAVEDGDVVRAPSITTRVRDRIIVQGHVWSAGTQGFTPGLTLTDALQRAGGLKSDAYLGTVHISRLRPDSTRVQLRATLLDTTGSTAEPIAIEGDDEITVYSRTEFRPPRHVSISGAVRQGGRFPWRAGLTLRDLVLMAGGLREHAYLAEAEIARIPEHEDRRATAIAVPVALDSSYLFDVPASAGTRQPDVALLPFDNVLIKYDPNWREPRTVTLTGEVRFPGTYTLQARADRLSDLVRRAGGLTPEADADGAYFARLVDSVSARQVISTAARISDGSRGATPISEPAADSALDGVVSRIRVGVDLLEAMRARDRSDDLILEQGDSIHVPKRRQTVEVRGAVNAPTALSHASGKRLGYYLDAAGGTTERARSRRAYVIQPNGKIESRRRALWVFTVDPKPRAGATVVVPERGEVAPGPSVLASLAVVTQILASLATIVVLTR